MLFTAKPINWPHGISKEKMCENILIEILFSGICHSDIHQVRSEWGPVGLSNGSRTRNQWVELRRLGYKIQSWRSGRYWLYG